MTKLWVIDGPPGTGKTRYLSQQAAHAAEKYGPDAVAIASLTRTAASEIRGRTDIHAENVSTLHAHAYRALDRPDLAETGDAIKEWNLEHPAAELSSGPRRIEDGPLVANDDDNGKTHTDTIHAQVAALRARRVPTDQWTPEQQAHDQAWEDFKTQTHRVDFTDLIAKALAELPQHPAMPDVLLLDEAQDFSRLELDLAAQWAQHTQTTVIVGDPRQALYTWRGSDADTLTELPATGRRLLEQSHRVPIAAHAIAQQWVSQLAIGAAPYHPTDQPGQAANAAYSLREPDQLIAAALQDLAEDPDATVMVLASCGYMLGALTKQLKNQGIPFHNPYRTSFAPWNPMRAADRLLAYLRPSRAVWGDQARPWTWDDLRLWTEPLRSTGVLPRGIKTFAQRKCAPDKFGETQANVEIDQETLGELLLDGTNLTNHPAFNLDVQWWEDGLLASHAKSLAYPLQILRTAGGPALHTKPRITVGTIHSVKGGEASSVYVSPDLSKDAYWHGWHGGGEPRDSIIRLGYVAATRTSGRLTVLEPTCPEHMPLQDVVRTIDRDARRAA